MASSTAVIQKSVGLDFFGKYTGDVGGEVSRDLGRGETAMHKFRSTAGTVGAAIGAATVVIGGESLKQALSVETSAGRMAAAQNVPKRAMDNFTNWVGANSAKLLQTQQNLIGGLQAAYKPLEAMGYGTQGIENVTASGAKLTALFGGDLTNNVGSASAMIRAFNVDQKHATEFIDAMGEAASKSGKGMDLYTGTFGKFVIAAHGAGLGYKEAFGWASTVAQQLPGQSARIVGTLGSVITKLQAAPMTASLQKKFTAAQLLGIDPTAMEKEHPGQGLAIALRNLQKDPALERAIAGSGPIGDLIKASQLFPVSLAKSAGYVNTAYGKVSKDTENQLKALNLEVMQFEVEIGKGLVPVLKQAIPMMDGLLHTVEGWAHRFPGGTNALIKMGLAIGAVGLALKGISVFTTPLKLLASLGGIPMGMGKEGKGAGAGGAVGEAEMLAGGGHKMSAALVELHADVVNMTGGAGGAGGKATSMAERRAQLGLPPAGGAAADEAAAKDAEKLAAKSGILSKILGPIGAGLGFLGIPGASKLGGLFAGGGTAAGAGEAGAAAGAGGEAGAAGIGAAGATGVAGLVAAAAAITSASAIAGLTGKDNALSIHSILRRVGVGDRPAYQSATLFNMLSPIRDVGRMAQILKSGRGSIFDAFQPGMGVARNLASAAGGSLFGGNRRYYDPVSGTFRNQFQEGPAGALWRRMTTPIAGSGWGQAAGRGIGVVGTGLGWLGNQLQLPGSAATVGNQVTAGIRAAMGGAGFLGTRLGGPLGGLGTLLFGPHGGLTGGLLSQLGNVGRYGNFISGGIQNVRGFAGGPGAIGNYLGTGLGWLGNRPGTIGARVGGLASSAGAFAQNMGGAIAGVGGAIGQGVGSNVGPVLDRLRSKLLGLGGDIAKAADWGTSLARNLGTGIGNGLGFVGSKIGAVWSTITGLAHKVGQAVDWGTSLARNLGTGIGHAAGFVGSKIGAVWNAITVGIPKKAGQAIGWGADLIHNLGAGINNATNYVGGQIGDVWNAITVGIPDKVNQAIGWGTDLLHNLGSGINSAQNWLGGQVDDTWTLVTQGIFGKINQAVSWGTGLIHNLGAGITSAKDFLGGILTTAENWVTSAFNTVKNDALTWGSQIIHNLATGITNGEKDLQKTISGFVKNLTGWLSPVKGLLNNLNPFSGGGSLGFTAAAGGFKGPIPRGDVPLGGQFGVGNVSWSPGNLAYSGLPNAATHMDFHTPVGERFYLPGGAKARWRLVKKTNVAGIGDWETWQSPNGGLIDFMHMESMTNLRVGGVYSGGTLLGLTGGQPGGAGDQYDITRAHSTGAHLHTAEDQRALQYLYSFYGGSGFSQYSGSWAYPGAVASGLGLGGGGGGGARKPQGPNWGAIPAAVRRWRSQILAASKATGMPPGILASAIMQESSGNPNERSWNPGENAWDIGLLQGGPQEFGANYSYNPAKNIMGGASILMKYYRQYGNWKDALDAYNGGNSPQGLANAGYTRTTLNGQTVMGYGNAVLQRAAGYGGSDATGTASATAAGKKIVLTIAQIWQQRVDAATKAMKQAFPSQLAFTDIPKGALSLWLKDTDHILWLQFKQRMASLSLWWKGLSKSQRADPAYQEIHKTLEAQVGRNIHNSMKAAADKVKNQPILANIADLKKQRQLLASALSEDKTPWTESKKLQERWLKNEYLLDRIKRKIQDDNAKLQLEQGKITKAEYQARIKADQDALNLANQDARYKLTHQGRSASQDKGVVIPAHIIGNCANEGAKAASKEHAKHTPPAGKSGPGVPGPGQPGYAGAHPGPGRNEIEAWDRRIEKLRREHKITWATEQREMAHPSDWFDRQWRQHHQQHHAGMAPTQGPGRNEIEAWDKRIEVLRRHHQISWAQEQREMGHPSSWFDRQWQQHHQHQHRAAHAYESPVGGANAHDPHGHAAKTATNTGQIATNTANIHTAVNGLREDVRLLATAIHTLAHRTGGPVDTSARNLSAKLTGNQLYGHSQ